MPSLKIIGSLVPEKTILKVFTMYGRGGHLGPNHLYELSFPLSTEDPREIWLIGPVVLEKIFESGGRRRIRKPEDPYSISSPDESHGSGELIK